MRIGTAGSIQPEALTGDIAVVTGAIRDEGTTRHYLPVEFPAIADVDVVCAMREATRRLGMRSHLGIAQSKDSFYGEVEPERMPMYNHLRERWQAWVAGGAVCSEMEASAILILSSIYRCRAGGVMLLIGNPVENQSEEEAKAYAAMLDGNRAIQVAVEGLKILIEQDLRTRSA